MNKYIQKFISMAFIGIGLGIVIGSTLNTITLSVKNEIEVQKTNPKVKTQLRKDQFRRNPINSLKALFKGLPKLQGPQKEVALIDLSSKWKELQEKNKDLQLSGYLYLINKKSFAELNSEVQLPAASSIKIPILVVILTMLDQQEVIWNEPLILSKDVIGGGSGWMAYQEVGKEFPLFEVAAEMIRISDNTATNMLIKRIGGINQLNERLRKLGLRKTELKNLLPDLQGTNLTTTKDLALSIKMADSGKLLSRKSRDMFREIMRTSKTNSMIPTGVLNALGKQSSDVDYSLFIKGYSILNKTGDIGISYADAALIQMPDNTRAVAGFIVKGPFNDPRSPELIRSMSSGMVPFLKPRTKSGVKY